MAHTSPTSRGKTSRIPSAPGTPSPLWVNLIRVFLALGLLYAGAGVWGAKKRPPKKFPAPIPPLTSGDGPTASYLSQAFSFRIDGIPTLRGFSGFGDAPKLDRNVHGQPLKVKGKEYPKGIGSQAASEIVFGLSGKVRRFSCLAGVDEQGGGTASLIFIVKADGKKVFESPLMRSDSDPLPVSLDVRSVKELALILDPAGSSDWDMGDWIGLKFEKGGP